MQAKSFSGPDAVALIVAVALHALLVALLLLQGATRAPPPEPERITVNFAEEVGMTSAAPDPVRESQASVAPELGESAPPPIEYAPPPPLPAPVPQPTSAPAPQPRPAPRATSRPQPRPTARASSRPEPRPTSRATSSAPRPEPTREARRSGGSRVGSDFLAGAGESTRSSDTRVPASQVGASARASIAAAISRQLKPHWAPPSGPDAEKIVSVIAWQMNEDGSLAGRPRLVRQTGINDTNRAQAERHAEQAIRAVQLAAPFDLPPEYYNAWKNVSAFSFDWNL
ncbi:energy transducer TonB [Alteriqipengyuania lutimaris]|uniref:Energy transducer TonB n=1 Tax=Alteriqipengyuania lutimaris TaxID=1538146 RepID=A0A395LHP7_9SPHN|nr:energy transducer TonB [Alteriqipengyuania lutimaris]MBB3035001.1 outer membrane biosynthesis protein TonB [Alteriqipengyuania lutimaris]RDS76185.1 energy transducer TonB [Alteriqipengyuania lutimaris]